MAATKSVTAEAAAAAEAGAEEAKEEGVDQRLAAVLENIAAKNKHISARPRSTEGFAGLINLGCICYMNSLLQQLYHISPLRRALLSTPVPDLSKEEKKEDLLYQTQRLFAFLADTDREAYNMRAFVNAYKDPATKKPVSVLQQQDVQEFLAVLFDRLESRLKGRPESKAFEYLFGGKTTSQLIKKGRCCSRWACFPRCVAVPTPFLLAEDPTQMKETPASFYCIDLEVKDLPDMQASLKKFISAEVLSDYKWDGVETETLKRTVISHLPNVLLVHLKRFEFNLHTFQVGCAAFV